MSIYHDRFILCISIYLDSSILIQVDEVISLYLDGFISRYIGISISTYSDILSDKYRYYSYFLDITRFISLYLDRFILINRSIFITCLDVYISIYFYRCISI